MPANAVQLPPPPPWLVNLPALWAVDPGLARAVESADEYPTESARSGDPTLAIDGVYQHSRHRPVDEADRQTAPIDAPGTMVFFVHGFGLGYAAERLFDRAGPDAVVCVFEPDVRLIRTALAARDLSRLVRSHRLVFFTKPDKSDLFVRLGPLTPLIALATAEVDHPPSVGREPGFHDQMKAWVAEFTSFGRTNLNTLVVNGRKTLENIAKNAARSAASPDPARLKDRYAGYPAVIVSAGPSLRKNKHLLKSLAGKAVVIAVQTTLQPLLELGVEPDFVTAIDYHEICRRFFEKLPPTLRTHLVAEPKATPVIFDLHPGPVTMLGNEHTDALLRERPPGLARLPAGSTVAHLAFYLAEHLGCGPVIFVGQDLGFSDGMCYSPGTAYDDVWRPETGRFCTVENKQWEQIVRERPILRQIPDHLGRPMYTEQRLFTYLQQFERDFLKSDRLVIDATEGGAAKRGTVTMTLAEAIEKHCTRPLPQVGDDDAVGKIYPVVDSLIARRDEAARIESISRQTLPLLQELRDHLEDQPRVNRLIVRIDSLRRDMNALAETYELVMQMSQSTDLDRFNADRRITAQKLTGVELQRRQVARDIDNVRGVLTAAADFQSLMDEAITTTDAPARLAA